VAAAADAVGTQEAQRRVGEAGGGEEIKSQADGSGCEAESARRSWKGEYKTKAEFG
jgi:hypothetical protein